MASPVELRQGHGKEDLILNLHLDKAIMTSVEGGRPLALCLLLPFFTGLHFLHSNA